MSDFTVLLLIVLASLVVTAFIVWAALIDPHSNGGL
jgi:hypothetical protein